MGRMIICICNRINCRAVRDAVESGARSPGAVQAHHGCRFNCGKCSSSISEMIAATAEREDACLPMVAAE